MDQIGKVSTARADLGRKADLESQADLGSQTDVDYQADLGPQAYLGHRAGLGSQADVDYQADLEPQAYLGHRADLGFRADGRKDGLERQAELFYFPVRHHSPACSLHLLKALSEFKPDLILIEGPGDTNTLIEHIAAPANEAPICIYYSYVEKETDFRSACYYPLLDYSPELCAIRFGARAGIESRFIDLPYSRLSLLERERKPSADEAGAKNSYYDDYYMFRSSFIERLCEKQGCRHYGELWEKLFEIHGLYMDTSRFIQSMLALCHYSRLDYPEELLAAEGCIEREDWMAAEIISAQKTHHRIFVITGGFHTQALFRLTSRQNVKGENASLSSQGMTRTNICAGSMGFKGDVVGRESVGFEDVAGGKSESREPESVVGNKGESREPESVVGNKGESREPESVVGNKGESREPESVVGNKGESTEPEGVAGSKGESVGSEDVAGGVGENAHNMKTKMMPKGTSRAWLIPYSFEESDQLAGYASGMPYPAFYQMVYEQIQKDPATAYDDSVLYFIARAGGALRREKESISIADEVAAMVQSKGLARLRDKPQQGVYELLDAVKSAYVKGSMDAAARTINTVALLLRGDRIGKVTSGTDEIPLLLDYRETAQKLRLNIRSTAKQEIILDILTKSNHRKSSVFFHRMRYLGTGFCELRAGSDYRTGNTERVREIWSYAAGARVESAIIDVSYLGGTIREAASSALVRAKEGKTGAGDFSAVLLDAAVMNLTEHVGGLLLEMEAAIAEDGSFDSLITAVSNLLFMENARWLLALPRGDFAESLLTAVYIKAVSILPALIAADDEEDYRLAKALKALNRVSERDGYDGDLFLDALKDLCDRQDIAPPPCLQGAAAGLLYAGGIVTVDAVLAMASAYLFGTGEQMKRSGRFLSGLFLTAWDILFNGQAFLTGVGHVLDSLSQDDFLALLPDLRLAFSVFTPSQIDRVSKLVAGLLRVESPEFDRPAVGEEIYALGLRLDDYAVHGDSSGKVGTIG